MAPGNRKAPQRAASSESAYSLVEFMADFPDDETCLAWLWNTRYNLGDDTAHCSRCGEIRHVPALLGQAAAPGLDLHGLWPSRAPDSGHDLSQVLHLASPLVLRHVPDDKHSLWHFCQAT